MLKKASNAVEILDLDGTKIHAVRADKAAYDDYADVLFDRDEKDGTLKVRSGRAMQEIYRKCVKKIENCDLGDGKPSTLENVEEMVAFLSHLTDPVIGKQIDNWLLNISVLDKAEAKN